MVGQAASKHHLFVAAGAAITTATAAAYSFRKNKI
jgi:hypothetical protein